LETKESGMFYPYFAHFAILSKADTGRALQETFDYSIYTDKLETYEMDVICSMTFHRHCTLDAFDGWWQGVSCLCLAFPAFSLQAVKFVNILGIEEDLDLIITCHIATISFQQRAQELYQLEEG
jgi:hypothetical protein